MKLKRSLVALPLLIMMLATSGCIITTDDDDSTFTVSNRSDFVLFELYITEIDNPDWGPNLLGSEPLFPGERISVVDIECDVYDVLVVDELNAECVLEGVDLCFDDAIWTITNSTLSTCPIFE